MRMMLVALIAAFVLVASAGQSLLVAGDIGPDRHSAVPVRLQAGDIGPDRNG